MAASEKSELMTIELLPVALSRASNDGLVKRSCPLSEVAELPGTRAMRRATTRFTLIVAVLSLAACEATMSGNADNSVAENACVEAVNTNSGSRGAMVMASEVSTAGTRVMVLSGASQTWTCNATNAGVVSELSVS